MYSQFTGSEGTEAPSLDDVTDDENDVTNPDVNKSLVTTPDQVSFSIRAKKSDFRGGANTS